MLKKGDTLIEVTLAIGIFSMVAVSVAAVMSNGTAGAETALETTLTREEIDAQAEALRFIHDSFISDQNHEDDRYSKLWTAITENALDPVGENINAIASYAPATCDELYTKKDDETQSPLGAQNAFVINTNYLGNYSNLDVSEVKEETIKNTIVSYKNSNDKFGIASTYPHLIYHNGSTTEDESVLTSDYDELLRAEGIYVIAVKDSGTTVAGEEAITTKSAFYDFYIRTCWYGVGDNFPSTISTVIRLYNPEAIVARKRKKPEPEPEPEPACEAFDGTEMQSFNPTDKSCDSGTLKDNRDGQGYTVKKFGDKYWLLDNLKLDITESGILNGLNPSNTNADDASLASLKSGNIKWGNNEPGFYNQAKANADNKNTKIGVYYNYCAASAGSYCYDENVGSGNAQYDLCPSGWSMPTGGDGSGNYYELYTNVFSSNNANFKKGLSTPLSGYFGDGVAYSQGVDGFFWSSTNHDGVRMRGLRVNSDVVETYSVLNRKDGIAIRCVKK